MSNSNEINKPIYNKCLNCYWCDNCPFKQKTEEEIAQMMKRANPNPNKFARYDNVKKYFDEYCEDYTPLTDDIDEDDVAYERALKERYDDYQELIDEQDE